MTNHIKKHKNYDPLQRKTPISRNRTKIIEMMELVDQDFITDIIIMSYYLKQKLANNSSDHILSVPCFIA